MKNENYENENYENYQNEQYNNAEHKDEGENIISKEDIYDIVSRASNLTKQITKKLEQNFVDEEEMKIMKEGVKNLSNSVKLMKDALLLQKTFEKNSPNRADIKSVKRMKYLFAIRHRKKFITYILHDLQLQLPQIFNGIDIANLSHKIDRLFSATFKKG